MVTRSVPSRLLLSVLVAASAIGQCDPAVAPGLGAPGVVGTVSALLPWDPDGTGPLGEQLVVGGGFTTAGTVRANGIARFDPGTGQWSPIGDLVGSINALARLPNGDLVAGGNGLSVGTTQMFGIARWDGVSWSALGSGLRTAFNNAAGTVNGLAVRPNGDLIVTGQFVRAGTVNAFGIARWDGSSWDSIGDLTLPWAAANGDAVVTLPNGDVVVGGFFTAAGGVPCTSIARWDGASWYALGSGLANAPGVISFPSVSSLLTRGNGTLVAGGNFGVAGGQPANRIAAWDGTAWSALGTGVEGTPTALLETTNGQLLVGGGGLVGGQHLVAWNGATWSGLGNLPEPRVLALAELGSGSLFAGGSFRPTGTLLARGIARWDGTTWQPLSTGTDGPVDRIVDLGGNRLLALGDFRSFLGVAAVRAAWFDGQNWAAAGEPAAGTVTAATAMPNGDAVVAFQPPVAYLGPTTVQRLGATGWVTLGVFNGRVRSLAVDPDGQLYAGGRFNFIGGTPVPNLVVWNGSGWAPALQPASDIEALLFTRSGRLVASGSSFPNATGPTNFVATWDGSQWQPMGGGLQQPATRLIELPAGDLVAIGNWVLVAGQTCLDIARWDGSSWDAVGSGLGQNSPYGDRVTCVGALPNGDIVAAGEFAVAGGVPARNIARWDGSGWRTLGSGADGVVEDLAVTAGGAIVIGGSFLTVADVGSASLARIEPTCPALAMPYGAGCSGSAGPVMLAIDDLPWAGGVLRSRVTGLSANSVVLSLIGANPIQVGLPTLLPQGTVGCFLRATPDFVQMVPVVGDTAQPATALPRSPALIGAVLYHQALPVEVATGGFAITASNGVALIVGGLW